MKALRCKAAALVIRDLPNGEDTGLRIVHAQTVASHGESYDGRWAYVVAPAGSGWSSLAYLEPAPPEIVPAWPEVPHGLVALRALYGEPGNPLCTAGTVHLPDSLPLSWETSERIRSFRCHQLVEGRMTSAFGELYRRGFWPLLEDYGGCYEYRKARGLATKLSTHAWGISVDVNARSNPLRAKPKMDLRVVAVMEDHGFLWGGRWSRPDGMHFQLATGY